MKDKLEKALLDATNLLAHMHNSRLETEQEPCLSETGIGWVIEWQKLIKDQSLVIRPRHW